MLPKEALKKYFSFDNFIGEQEPIIEQIVDARKPALVLMPTGGGKSLCYQVPALCLEGGTLVISPLIALMQDQVDGLRKRGVPAHFVNSTVSKLERESRVADFVSGKLKLLYVTPERFRKERFVSAIREANISLLAIDEAHCISEWGHDFRPDYSRVGEFRALINNPLTIALTATATPSVQKDIIKRLNLEPDKVRIFNQGISRPNLELQVEQVYGDDQKIDQIIKTREEFPGSGIVYFSLIKTLEQYSELLQRRKINHTIYHGKLDPGERKRRQRAFLNGRVELVLATNAFGMGIDKPDIRYVIHCELPGSIEQYYQEVGRAGRDGKPSRCLLLYSEDDLAIQLDFVKWANPDEDFYRRIFGLITTELERVNSGGIDFLREQMHYKNRRDFRIETALNMLDRYGVVSGNIDRHDLQICSDSLPSELLDSTQRAAKLRSDQEKLLAMMQYAKAADGHRTLINRYFGAE